MRVPLSAAAVLALAGGLAAAGPSAPSKASPPEDVEDVIYLGESRPLLVRLHLEVDGRPLRAVWEGFVDQVFRHLDSDGDGVLTRAEAERIPPPAVLLGNGLLANLPTPWLTSLAADGESKLTRAALAAYYRRSGVGPFHFRASPPAADGMARVRVLGAGGGPRPSADALNNALFKLLDTDRDGMLSKKELAAAPQLLQKLDADDDEMVSARELLGEPPPPTEGGLAFVVLGDEAAPDPAGPFVAAPGRPDRVLARRLLARYGPPGGPQPHRLTPADIALSREAFAALDADRDGTLDAEELARFTARPADLEFRVRLGARGQGKPALEAVDAAGRPVLAPAGYAKTTEGHALLELPGATRIEFRVGEEPGGIKFRVSGRDQYLAQFKAADRDNNGYLDRSEAMQNPFFRSTFRSMDRDGDGKLFEKELIAYLDKVESLQAAAQKACVSLDVGDEGRGLFDLLDTNRDGRLGVRELRQAAKLVTKLDRNGDGKISRNEIPRNYRIDFRQGASGNFGGNVVFASAVPSPEPQPPEPTAGPLWFRKMDRNRDGDVSRREFLGSDEEFRRLDLNGDGLVGLDEAMKVDSSLRKTARNPH